MILGCDQNKSQRMISLGKIQNLDYLRLMRDIPSSYVDAKRYFLEKDAYPNPYNYFFTRYSSPYRIIATTSGATLFGGLYGIAWAIYNNLPKTGYLLRCSLGTFAFSACYSLLNEVTNGVIKRNRKKEQFFVSNTAAAVITMGAVHVFQGLQKIERQQSLRRAFKYVGSLCVLNMYLETKLIEQRDVFLERKRKGFLETLNFSFNIGGEGQRENLIHREKSQVSSQIEQPITKQEPKEVKPKEKVVSQS